MYAMLCVCKIHRYTNCFNYKSLKNYKFNLFRNDRLLGVIFNCLKKFVLVEMIRKTMMCVMYPVASNNTEDPLVTISLPFLALFSPSTKVVTHKCGWHKGTSH